MGKVVGIDLGTTFSAIAHINDFGQEEIIPNDDNDRITPSVILFDDDKVTVGKIAKNQASSMPEQIVEFVKREMGQSKEQYSREFDGKEYSPEELSAQILLKLKQDAEAYLKTDVTDAVITVPAYFKDSERQATRLAGEIAGLNVLQVLNEPTAAALAYGVDLHGSDQTVFVFDLGGGTFDVTIMNVSGSKLEMIATNGDHRLGGKDWDDKIIDYVAEMFKIEHGVDPLDDKHTYQDIQLNAISAKESLSKQMKTKIFCGYDGKRSVVELTREKFAELTAVLIESCKSLCELVLTEAEMTWEDIDGVLLVGGSTRMPMIQEMIADISGKEVNPREVNPDEVVALGAAVQGTLRQIEEVTSGTSETATEKDIPEAVMDRFVGPGGELTVEVVDGATHNFGLVPLNERGEEYIHVMIPKMTPVPCEIEDKFGTVEDNQTSVLIEVVQGLEQGKLKEEIPEFEKDFKIGECLLEGLPPNEPKGSPITVTYKYNLDQILEVKVMGKGGVTANATIERKTLDDAEVAEATQHLENLKVE